MIGGSRRLSPWSADPLSWFAVPHLAFACMGYALVQALVVLSIPGQIGAQPVRQWVALGLMQMVFLAIGVATRPRRGPVPEGLAWLFLCVALLALAASGGGYHGSAFRVELWWAPVSVSLILISLAPYSTAAQLARLGFVALVVASALVVPLVQFHGARWPLLTTILIAVNQIVVSMTGSIVFIGVVTRLIARWSERPLRGETTLGIDPDGTRGECSESLEDELVDQVDAATAARLEVPVAFLREVLARGRIEHADQQRALELAELLRAELISAADQTWLQRLVRGHPVEVDDPERLAERLTLPQRTALRAMLDALLAHPDSGFVSGRVELKAADRGAVAVGLRILNTLPEGRRVTFLAPYYMTLHSTVRDIRWRNGAVLEVEFEAPVNDDGRPSLVQRAPAPAPEPPRR